MKGQNNKTLIVFDKLVNKLLVGKTIKKDIFSYEFISSSINSYDYDRVDIKINVIIKTIKIMQNIVPIFVNFSIF